MKKLLITGGNGGIGSAIIEKFKTYEYEVNSLTHSFLDLNNPHAIQKYISENQMDYDVFIHAAGINSPEKFENLTDEVIRKTYEVNTMSFIQLCRGVYPAMRQKKQGRILTFSSLFGIISRRGRLAYTLSKHALIGAIQTLSLELGPTGVLVNAISPGFVNTPLTHKNNTPEQISILESKIPLGRMATPHEIAEVAFFLCSDYNTYITGQNIIIDGGFSAGGYL